MDPVLRYFILLLKATGLYFGPPRVMNLIRLSKIYCLLVTLGFFFFSVASFVGSVVKGLDILYQRVGSDQQATREYIASLRPISALTLKAWITTYYLSFVQVYWMVLVSGRRLIACLDSRHYRTTHSSKKVAISMVALWGLFRFFGAFRTFNAHTSFLLWFFVLLHIIFKVCHFYFFYAMIPYFIYINNRCVNRQLADIIRARTSLTTIMGRVRLMKEIGDNFDRFNWIISDVLLIYCLHMILQVTYNLSYSVFQKKRGSLFTQNIAWLIVSQCAWIALACLMASVLDHNFDQFHGEVNQEIDREIRRQKQPGNPQLNHWRVEGLLFSHLKDKLRLRIFHVCSLNIGTFFQASIFAFDTAILLYQTEFP